MVGVVIYLNGADVLETVKPTIIYDVAFPLYSINEISKEA